MQATQPALLYSTKSAGYQIDLFVRDRGRSVIEGANSSYIRFRPRQFRLKLIVFTVCEPVYMNMGPFHC